MDVDGRSPWQRGEPLGLGQAGVRLLALARHCHRPLLAGGGDGSGGWPRRADQFVHAEAHRPGVQHEVRGPIGVLQVRQRGSEASSAVDSGKCNLRPLEPLETIGIDMQKPDLRTPSIMVNG